MRRFAIHGAIALVALMSVGAARAEVDCEQVMLQLKAGKTPQDVADTMGITSARMKECRDAADAKAKLAKARGDDTVIDGSTAAPEGAKSR